MSLRLPKNARKNPNKKIDICLQSGTFDENHVHVRCESEVTQTEGEQEWLRESPEQADPRRIRGLRI